MAERQGGKADNLDVDRSGLAATRVYGITDDLNMSTTDFATAIAILFGKSLAPCTES